MSVFSVEYFIGLTKKRGKIWLHPWEYILEGSKFFIFIKIKKAKKKEIGLDLNPFGFVELS